MRRIHSIIILSIIGFVFTACGADRAGNDAHSKAVLGVSDTTLEDNSSLDTNATNNTNTPIIDNDGVPNDNNTTTPETNSSNEANSTTTPIIDNDNGGVTDENNTKTPDTNSTNETNSTTTPVIDSDKDGLSDEDEVNLYGTNPNSNDSDNDGLLDGDEINTYDTNASNPDSDGDCLLDSFEILNYETNASNSDSDGDGRADGIEIYSYVLNETNSSCLTTPETLAGGHNDAPAKDNRPNDGTDVINALDSNLLVDSDGDGIADIDEINLYGTNPNSNDSDNDGLLDGDELNIYDTNASNPDSDGDCLLDSFEILNYETNVSNSDSDGDGRADGIEIYSYVLNETNSSCLTTPETLAGGANNSPAMDNRFNGNDTDVINALDPNLLVDSDGDGVADIDEINLYGTNPNSNDSDNDGLLDGDEINTYGTNASNPDSDGDCLLDSFEILNYETNASNSDSDGDGRADGIEIYSYVLNETNSSCLTTPETLAGGANNSPAMDNRFNGNDTDVINALDPNLLVDSDGDGIADIDEEEIYGTNPNSNDSDNDGLLDGDEINTYGTNASNPDSDGDGLADGMEVYTYGTNPSSSDSDSDGLSDPDEITIHETNASNPDTDGDCLLDSFEILNYETNATNTDTDGDGVEDGLEVYGDLDSVCVTIPETLVLGANLTPAKDNLTNPDVIDALDPTNDSDGDQQSNQKEMECAEGDVKDNTKMCPFITNTEEGKSLVSTGFIYIPGGFDVDGDGINEKGFWTSAYHARANDDEQVSSDDVNILVGKFNTYIQNNFFMVNATEIISSTIHGYSDDLLSDTLVNEAVPIGKVLEFSANLNPQLRRRVSGIMPFMATLSLSGYKVYDSSGSDLGLDLTLLSLKQYAHIQQLLEADKNSGGTGNTIRNGLLGLDTNVPSLTYSKTIHEFGEGYKEYLKSIMQMKEGNVVLSSEALWVEDWMGIDQDRIVRNPNETDVNGDLIAKGSDANIDVGMGVGPMRDNYGVLVRSGAVLDLTLGVTGASSDQFGTYDGVGFRAATAYVE